MERINAYYPVGTENILHHSHDGREYRLDAVDQPVRIKDALGLDSRFKVIPVHKKDDTVLKLAHSNDLIRSYKSGIPIDLANSSGLEWQRGFYNWIVNKAWATIEGANEAIKNGKSIVVSSGGHHSEFEHGRGFGPIGNMIIAAKHLLNEGVINKIAILDLDVHFANGTHSQVKNEKRILSCDLWRYRLPKWIYTPNSSNVLHKKVENIDEYSNGIELMFNRINIFNPNLLFVYNGLDPLDNDRMGGVKGFNQKYLFDRNERVSEFVQKNKLPVCVFIGGGYINYKQTDLEIEKSKVDLTKLFVESSAVVLGL